MNAINGFKPHTCSEILFKPIICARRKVADVYMDVAIVATHWDRKVRRPRTTTFRVFHISLTYEFQSDISLTIHIVIDYREENISLSTAHNYKHVNKPTKCTLGGKVLNAFICFWDCEKMFSKSEISEIQWLLALAADH